MRRRHPGLEAIKIKRVSSEELLVEFSDVRAVREGEVFLSLRSQPIHLEDDDGGALPPRHSADQNAEPVNRYEVEEDAVHGP